MIKYIFILFLFPLYCQAQDTLFGKAVKIIDGDTFDLLIDGNKLIRIRLLDIDCPEKGQDYFKVAKMALGDFLSNSKIRVVYHKKDRNGRILGTVFSGKVNVNYVMVQEGYAWHFKKFSKDDRFAEVEKLAMKAKRGLWKYPKPIPPWDFRQARRQL